MFPQIYNISDVLPHIEGNDNFYIAEKDGYKVINYLVNFEDTFPEDKPILRELRGIKFDSKTGDIICRPLHKFFNIGEKPETRLENVDFTQPFCILEKLDGTMIAPFYCNGRIIWGTKMGETEFSPLVEEFVKNNPQYLELTKALLDEESTPIFEFMANENRVVIDYGKPRMVLLAIRDNCFGAYLNLTRNHFARNFPEVEVVKQFPFNHKSINDFIEHVRNENNVEGYVIQFNDGNMMKVKSDWYINLHKIKSYIDTEYTIVSMILNNTIDDVLGILSEKDKEYVLDLEKVIKDFIQKIDGEISNCVDTILKNNWTRKDFAINMMKNVCPITSTMIFKWFDGGDVVAKTIIEFILNRTCSSSTWKEFKNKNGIVKKDR